MLVLEATSKRQGERPGDYHWCTDGELAYNQGFDCSCTDCGCERGWAGFESRSATTTVQVVERSEFSVERLASELADSLFNGGWIQTADPTDVLVASIAEEIVETANHFGEGAVLERDGGWIRLRDGSNEATNPLNRLFLEELTEHFLEAGPMDMVSGAMQVLSSSPGFEEPLLAALSDAAWPEAQSLGCAIDWLHHGKLTYEWVDVPRWLLHFDQAVVTESRRSRSEDWEGHLLTIEFDGQLLGIASVGIEEEGCIRAFFAIYEDAQTQIALQKNLQRQHYTPYRKILPKTALRAIRSASELPVLKPAVVPGVSWPHNRPLFDFIVDQMVWVGAKAR